MSEIFDTINYVDILRPSYTSSSNSPYPCPPTTYAATYERTTFGQGLSAFKGCSVCPYPQSSVSGSREISNCTCPQCGDSKLSWQGKEQCDDGNSLNFDGCASTCTIEKLQLCEGPRDQKSGVGLPISSYSERDECFRVGSYWTRYGNATYALCLMPYTCLMPYALCLILGMATPTGELVSGTGLFGIRTQSGSSVVLLQTSRAFITTHGTKKPTVPSAWHQSRSGTVATTTRSLACSGSFSNRNLRIRHGPNSSMKMQEFSSLAASTDL